MRGGVLRFADMDLAGEEGTRGQHDGRRMEGQAGLGDRAADGAVLDDQIIDGSLEQRQVGLRFHRTADRTAVQRTVGLAARGAHGRPLRRIERAPLDAGAVGGPGHHAAQRIDLLDQMTLADAADGRVAAHRADRFHVVRQQQRARTRAGRSERCLGAGMAAADDDDVVVVEAGAHGLSGFGSEGRGRGALRKDGMRMARRQSWHASCCIPRHPSWQATRGAGLVMEQGPAMRTPGMPRGR